jgi:hypothetical protein
MKHIIFIFLLLALTSCSQNRNDEYVCNPETKDFTEAVKIIILKDKVSTATQGDKKYTYDILEETSKKIVFGYKETMEVDTAPYTFFKRTKKYEVDHATSDNSFFGIWGCEKIN